MVLVEIVEKVLIKIMDFLEYIDFKITKQMIDLSYLLLLLVMTIIILCIANIIITRIKMLFKKEV